MIRSISIVFPCYNEADRLKYTFKDIKKFQEKKITSNFEIIFVNDGSSDNTFQILKKYKNENAKLNRKIKIISYQNNKGKGYALKKGIKIARFDWILTLDTDISVSITQLSDWIKHKKIKEKKFIYFGSRNLTDSNIKFKMYRKLIGLIFVKIIKIFFKINLSDTQCGFKLYKKTMAQKIFRNLKEKGYVHDIEIVLKALNKKYEIVELPVTWVHKKNSKISFIKDSFKILSSLIVLKQKN